MPYQRRWGRRLYFLNLAAPSDRDSYALAKVLARYHRKRRLVLAEIGSVDRKPVRVEIGTRCVRFTGRFVFRSVKEIPKN